MKSTQTHRGIALVIVLGFLVLLSGLAIAFFSSVTTELGASRTYANNVTTRQLSDSAINLVMGQIREATARAGATWGSQPGLIRVYRGTSDDSNDTPSAYADAFYKLYSARNMVVTKSQIKGGFDPGAKPASFNSDPDGDKGDVPSDWDKYPALFTDLNSPILVSDPAKLGSAAAPVFPILDPRAKEEVDGQPLIEGFDFTDDVNKAVASGNSDSLRVPMPVRWIYVLRDGTLTVPQKESSSSGGVTGAEWSYSGTSAFKNPTKDNPIVGRIAFWADDDTSKVNINTAGGRGKQSSGGYSDGYDANSYAGSFWDTPRFFTNFDIGQTDKDDGTLLPGVGAGGLASTQPFQKEFQRYPGHPATTSLGAVFARLLTSEQIYKLAPRLQVGGSKGGTFRTSVDNAKALALGVGLKKERLYASLDELLYSEKPVNGGKRETNDDYVGVSGAVTPDKLEKMKFFLTAHSRAPDLNLFGRPRVAIWPVNIDEKGRNGFDRAIAYCSTIGGQRFIFTRVTGLNGGAFNTSVDMLSSGNANLMKYLRELTDRKIPGFGGKFVDKYGTANRDAILGQIFDYIRIANLRDTTDGMEPYQYSKYGVVAPSRANVFGTGKVGGFGRCATISEATIVFYVSGVSVDQGKTFVQTEIPEQQKDGITHRAVRAFVFFSTFDPMQGYAPVVTSPPGSTDEERKKSRQTFEVKGLENFAINNEKMGFPATAVNTSLYYSGNTWAGRNFGGYEGFFHTLKGHGGTAADTAYQLRSSKDIKLPVADPTFSFSGGDLEVKIYMGSGTLPKELLQTINLKFEGGSWPVPERWYRISPGGFVAAGQANFNVTDDPAANATPGTGQAARVEQAQNLLDFGGFRGRINWTDLTSSNPTQAGMRAGDRWRQIVQPGDIVRSLVYGSYPETAGPTKDGDLRLLMLTENVDKKEFRPHPDYFTDARFACSLRAGDGQLYLQSNNLPCWKVDAKAGNQSSALTENATTFGKHVPSVVNVVASKAVALPMSRLGKGGVNEIRRSDNANPPQQGDFDTGMGTFPDGPYTGKQDEGNVIYKYWDHSLQKFIYPIPYASTHAYEEPGDIFFSPNRQMPSAVLFGSLLARPKDTNPRRQWETLAFCPNTCGEKHPGNMLANGNPLTPRDHLLLDFFTMPFVEPYLISEPLSTAGRVNLNYQIAPFGYIKRSTGLRAALHPLRVTAVKSELLNTYKTGQNSKPLAQDKDNPRLEINRDETVAAMDGFFEQYKSDRNSGFFKSATEICERFLYPQGPGVNPKFTGSVYDPVKNSSGESAIITFWKGRKLTGDNVREKPYADLYPRITTKSNTYTVHMRVQTIRQVGVGGDYTKWQEGRDVVLGEYRGSSTIERFIDPSDPRLVQKVVETDPAKQSLEDLYRFRVVDTKKFTP